MSRSFTLRPGCAYSFHYPRHNFRGILSSLERRRLLVSSVRDLKREPLNSTTSKLQPLLIRGRYLVTGHDLDCHAERSFYMESMRGVSELEPTDSAQTPPERNLYLIVDEGHVQQTSTDELTARHHLRDRGRGLLCQVLKAELGLFLRGSQTKSERSATRKRKRA